MDLPSMKQLINDRLSPVLPRIPVLIEEAYKKAREMGRKDGEDIYCSPLEKERLADDQGRSVQDILVKWASTYPGIEARWEENPRKLPHATLYVDELRITAHRVLEPGSSPRYAWYRQQNALSNMHWLPGFEPSYDPAKGIYLYLLHGPSREDKCAVGFIQLAVPAPKGTGLLYISDLKAEEQKVADVENIPEKTLTSLKIKVAKSNEN